MLYNGVCSNGDDDGHTFVLKIHPNSSVVQCDRQFVDYRPVSFAVSVSIIEPSGELKLIHTQEWDGTNYWDGQILERELLLNPNRKYSISVQVWQECSYCCNIGTSLCTQPASFMKNAGLYFYGQVIVNENDFSQTAYISLFNCDCRGC